MPFLYCRPEYGYLVNLKLQLPHVPVMALTATATSHVKEQLQKMLEDPLIEISNINKPNITFHAMELTKLPKNGSYYLINTYIHTKSLMSHSANSSGTASYYSLLSDHLFDLIQQQRAIVYTDFVKDVAPLAIALREKGINTCGYHGKSLSSHDKVKAVENWCIDNSNIQVSIFSIIICICNKIN